MGWKPTVQGGNGKGPTIAQQLLACAIGWNMEVVVKTNMQLQDGYPHCYKLDIANEVLKIDVEVDGNSHMALARQEQDRKRDSFLSSQGWTVLRFTNKEITQNLNSCVQVVLSTISGLNKITTILQTES